MQFKRALADEYDIRVLAYPLLDLRAPRMISFAETLAMIRSEIEQTQPGAPLRLLGYSYGGYIAVELARYFMLADREIAFVGLIDTLYDPLADVKSPSVERQAPYIGRPFAGDWRALPQRFAGGVVRKYLRLAYRLVRRGSLGHLAKIVRGIERLGYTRTKALLWWHITQMTRRASVIDYSPGDYPGELWLFRVPDEPDRPHLEDYGWGRHCRTLSIDWVTGRHDTIFNPENVTALANAARKALARSMGMPAPISNSPRAVVPPG